MFLMFLVRREEEGPAAVFWLLFFSRRDLRNEEVKIAELGKEKSSRRKTLLAALGSKVGRMSYRNIKRPRSQHLVPFGSMVIKHLPIDLTERKGELIGVIENLLLCLFFFHVKLEASQPRVSLSPYPAYKNREQAGKWNKLLT